MKASNKKFISSFIPLTKILVSNVFANQAEIGSENNYMYLGGKLGSIRFQHGCESFATECDKRDRTLGMFAGYQFNQSFSLETTLLDLGKATAKYRESGQENTYIGSMKGWDIGVNYDIPISNTVKPYLGVGLVNWQGENKGPNSKTSDSGWAFTSSIGIKYNLNDNFQARLSYQYIDDLGSDLIGSSNGHVGWLGLSYLFKNTKYRSPTKAAPVIAAQKETLAETIEQKVQVRPVLIKPVSAIVIFDFNSTYFQQNPSFNALLDHLKKYNQSTVSIAAHADSQGNEQYNLSLSKKRAEYIKKILIERGIDSTRISTKYLGETQPRYKNDTKEHKRLNRRAVITTNEFEILQQQGIN